MDYFFGHEANQFSFFRVPKELFSNDKYKSLSCEAKLLYGLMLDRMALSQKNNWLDEYNRVYIYFTLEDCQDFLCCSHTKAVKLFKELDTVCGVGLIERKKQGMGRPAIIYVLNFVEKEEKNEPEKSKDEDCPFETSINEKSETGFYCETSCFENARLPESGSHDFQKTEGNYTDINNTEVNHTHILSDQKEQPPLSISAYIDLVKKQISYDGYCVQNPGDQHRLDEIVTLIVEVLTGDKPSIWINKENKPAELVKAQFKKLNFLHIQYVFECLDRNTSSVASVKNYLLTALYNAPLTMSNHYYTQAIHDMVQKE